MWEHVSNNKCNNINKTCRAARGELLVSSDTTGSGRPIAFVSRQLPSPVCVSIRDHLPPMPWAIRETEVSELHNTHILEK